MCILEMHILLYFRKIGSLCILSHGIVEMELLVVL